MADIQTNKDFHVIIVGAGPAGLILALMLAQKGIRATVLEKADDIDRNPRASFYSAPTIHELRRAGLMDDIMRQAFVPDGVSWRVLGRDGPPTGEVEGEESSSSTSSTEIEQLFPHVCTIRAENPPGAETMISLPLDELLPIVVAHLARHNPAAGGRLLFGHEVVAIGQDAGRAWVDVDVRTPEGTTKKRFEGDYVVGCDGANSKIRRELFGDRFPGFTWDKQIVATNVYMPKFKEFGWTSSTFQIHPEHFPMIAQLTKDGLLRITYGEDINLTHDEMRARLPAKFKTFVPGAPEPGEYRVVNFSPYKIHQRCAEKFREGRFLLVADAAHLCNPFGGMGLTGGLVDAGNLFDCLYGLATGRADDAILDRYSDVRTAAYRDVVDPVSSSNLRRLWDPRPEAVRVDPFFQAVARAATDEAFAEEMKKGVLAVMHDFTQYYHHHQKEQPAAAAGAEEQRKGGPHVEHQENAPRPVAA